MLFCLDSCLHVDIVTVLRIREIIVEVFNLELRLDANYAHKITTCKITCRRSSSGGVVTCAGALFIVFLLDTDMRYALVHGNGVSQMESVRFSTCVSKVTC